MWPRTSRARSQTARNWATLLVTPLVRSKRRCVVRAMTSASVVLPVPGGP